MEFVCSALQDQKNLQVWHDFTAAISSSSNLIRIPQIANTEKGGLINPFDQHYPSKVYNRFLTYFHPTFWPAEQVKVIHRIYQLLNAQGQNHYFENARKAVVEGLDKLLKALMNRTQIKKFKQKYLTKFENHLTETYNGYFEIIKQTVNVFRGRPTSTDLLFKTFNNYYAKMSNGPMTDWFQRKEVSTNQRKRALKYLLSKAYSITMMKDENPLKESMLSELRNDCKTSLKTFRDTVPGLFILVKINDKRWDSVENFMWMAITAMLDGEMEVAWKSDTVRKLIMEQISQSGADENARSYFWSIAKDYLSNDAK